MKNKLYVFLFLTACASSHKDLSDNEKNYNAVSDSLVKYKTEIIVDSGAILPTMSDYMKLDYSSYQSKYRLSDKEMEELAQTLTVSYQVARTMKEIDNNMSITTGKSDSLLEKSEKDETDYKFDPKNISDNENELDVLMEAYDGDIQSKKINKKQE